MRDDHDEYAWDHGDYAAEINTNYIGFAGPGVRQLGLQGLPPNEGPNSAGPNSGQEVVADSGTTGPWTDETDIRPTLMYLTGLKDDYEHDGRVITQILAHPNQRLAARASPTWEPATSSSIPVSASSLITLCKPTPRRSRAIRPGTPST